MQLCSRLAAIPGLRILEYAPLSRYTRFAIGGAARVLADATTEASLADALQVIRDLDVPHTVIGGGSNLVVSDEGYSGVVLRYTASEIRTDGERVYVEAGALLQNLVDATIDAGLAGVETMTGIPGWVGGAVYGNAGAYGRSIHETVESVRFYDGAAVREIDNAGCQFRYRESIFKQRKEWIILSAALRMTPADAAAMRAKADGILTIRNEKYPPTMHCAGSIFKNILAADLPESLLAQVPAKAIREGKIPSAYFLEEAGAKGLVKGGVCVAAYHANLIYNTGGGTAVQVRELIAELKQRVMKKFGLLLEEEVQYVQNR